MPPKPQWHLVDIGLNLTDKMFTGTYNGHRWHKPDVEAVLHRATAVGVSGLILTGANVKTSTKVVNLCEKHNSEVLRCVCTVGCHPTRCTEFEADPDAYLRQLDQLITEHSSVKGGCVVALGEIGLDYDRLFFCPKETQLTYFAKQLDLAEKHQLPLFLHDRNTGGDFYDIISANRKRFPGGVVHSFTGTKEDLQRYLDLELFIGINGCSLKTSENLDVAKAVPLDRLLIETDGPWCDLRNTHASRALLQTAAKQSPLGKCVSDSLLAQFPTCRKEKFVEGAMVKGRCEPCNLVEVLQVLYELHRDDVESIEALAAIVYENTKRLFKLGDPSNAATPAS